MVAERRQCPAIGRHGMVVEEAGDDLPQPPSLLGDRLMHPSPQFLLDLQELCPHAVAPGFPAEQELTLARLSANEGEAQEVEGFRFCEPELGASPAA